MSVENRVAELIANAKQIGLGDNNYDPLVANENAKGSSFNTETIADAPVVEETPAPAVEVSPEAPAIEQANIFDTPQEGPVFENTAPEEMQVPAAGLDINNVELPETEEAATVVTAEASLAEENAPVMQTAEATVVEENNYDNLIKPAELTEEAVVTAAPAPSIEAQEMPVAQTEDPFVVMLEELENTYLKYREEKEAEIKALNEKVEAYKNAYNELKKQVAAPAQENQNMNMAA